MFRNAPRLSLALWVYCAEQQDLKKRYLASIFSLCLLTGCELTPEDQAAILAGLSAGLQDVQTAGYAGSGYGTYGGVSGRSIQLCARRGNGRANIVYATWRSGVELNRAVGGNVYRTDRNYITVPAPYGAALISVPAWASIAEGPIYGTDQQGGRWVLSSANGCGY